jgi:hypothetical protein
MPRKVVSSAQSYPPLLALGPWQNEDTFWEALVERKNLPHLGYPLGRSQVRDGLALGRLVFAGAPDVANDPRNHLAFIVRRTKEYLKGDHLHRISFDVTGMARLTGRLGNGFFVIRELTFVLAQDDLFRKTSWYENGSYLRMARMRLRTYLQSLRPS